MRLLGPLLQLESSTELTGLARGISFQIGEALGVLERAKVLNDVHSLDQDARASLRKAGIRFGAYHLYLRGPAEAGAPRSGDPALGAAERRPRAEGHRRDRRISPSPAATSIPVDPEIGHGLYRAAGFRVLGGRGPCASIFLERLADLIRPAIAYHPGHHPRRAPGRCRRWRGLRPDGRHDPLSSAAPARISPPS